MVVRNYRSPYVANATLRRDPTRTVTLRREYRRDLVKRFRRITTLIRQAVVDNDALFLEADRRLPLVTSQASAATRFDFPTDQDKVAAFMDWLRNAIDQEILEPYGPAGTGQRVTPRGAFQNVFVRRAYQKGVERADVELRRAGFEATAGEVAAFLRGPQSIDAMQLLFTRNFEELRGITSVMSQQIARELTQGLAEGVGTKEIARRLADRVQKVGMHRATLLARSEVIRAHAEGSLNRYGSMGVRGVSAQVEFSTAGDDRVCEVCAGLEGRVYTLDEARGLIPVHAQCRCAWLPVPITANQAVWLAMVGMATNAQLARIN